MAEADNISEFLQTIRWIMALTQTPTHTTQGADGSIGAEMFGKQLLP